MDWTPEQISKLATIRKLLETPTLQNLQDADAILQGLTIERSQALYTTIAAKKEIQDAT